MENKGILTFPGLTLIILIIGIILQNLFLTVGMAMGAPDILGNVASYYDLKSSIRNIILFIGYYSHFFIGGFGIFFGLYQLYKKIYIGSIIGIALLILWIYITDTVFDFISGIASIA